MFPYKLNRICCSCERFKLNSLTACQITCTNQTADSSSPANDGDYKRTETLLTAKELVRREP